MCAYAHDRGIRIVPEFEMPGHSRSLFAGYPELASGPGPYKIEPGGADAVMDPTREETYKFIDKFVKEMAKLFPDDYFHIGGDEVNSGHAMLRSQNACGLRPRCKIQARCTQGLIS
jgi:hexosaminidase